MRRLLIALAFITAPAAAQSPNWQPVPLTQDMAYYDTHIVARADGTRVLHILLPGDGLFEQGSSAFDCHGKWRVLSDSLFRVEPDSVTGRPGAVFDRAFAPDSAWRTIRPQSNAVTLQLLACGRAS